MHRLADIYEYVTTVNVPAELEEQSVQDMQCANIRRLAARTPLAYVQPSPPKQGAS
jgi:hypothetical protein